MNELEQDYSGRLGAALEEWFEKTEWLTKTYQPKDLGKHRADILRERITELESQLEAVGSGGASTLIPPKQCNHEFYRFGDQKERRCNWCSVNESQAATANPPVAVPAGMPKPARVPLDAVQMAAGRESIFSTGNPYCPCDSKTFRKVAKWVERHHGITVEQGGA